MKRSYTFEVFVESLGRDRIDGSYETEADARGRAEYLLGQARFSSVRVVKVGARGKGETIYEKAYRGGGGGKVVSIGQLDDAPLCEEVGDLYRYPARRALARIMRPWCDDQTMTPLEVLHRPILLRQIGRTEVLFNQLINRLATLQAKRAHMLPTDRADKLRRLYFEAFELAKGVEALKPWGDHIRRGGVTGVIEAAEAELPEEDRDRVVTYALACWLETARDWPQKLDALCDLFDFHPDPVAVAILDEAIAEALDGPAPIRAVIGYSPDLASALKTLALTVRGALDERHPHTPALLRLNELIGQYGLPLTQASLLGRIARTLEGTTPLTKTGKTWDAIQFREILPMLREMGGFRGGPAMCTAVTRRAQIALGAEDEDLPVEDAVQTILAKMPDPGSRIGYLLDLLASDFGKRRATALTRKLAAIFTELNSLRDFFAGQPDAWASAEVRDKFRARLYGGGVRTDVADLFMRRIEQLTSALYPQLALPAPGGGPRVSRQPDPEEVQTVCLQLQVLADPPVIKGPHLILYYQGDEHICDSQRAEVVLGRSSRCDLRCESKTASRRHAFIRNRQGEFVLSDRSRNGTYVRIGAQKPVVVLNASLTLEGSGEIYLGADPAADGVDREHLIVYRTVKGT